MVATRAVVLVVALATCFASRTMGYRRKRKARARGADIGSFIDRMKHATETSQKVAGAKDATSGMLQVNETLPDRFFGGGFLGQDGANEPGISDSLKMLFWSIDNNNDQIVTLYECRKFVTHDNCFPCLNQLFPVLFSTPDEVCSYFVSPTEHKIDQSDYETSMGDLKEGKGGKGSSLLQKKNRQEAEESEGNRFVESASIEAVDGAEERVQLEHAIVDLRRLGNEVAADVLQSHLGTLPIAVNDVQALSLESSRDATNALLEQRMNDAVAESRLDSSLYGTKGCI